MEYFLDNSQDDDSSDGDILSESENKSTAIEEEECDSEVDAPLAKVEEVGS